jgi:hypothetical protein
MDSGGYPERIYSTDMKELTDCYREAVADETTAVTPVYDQVQQLLDTAATTAREDLIAMGLDLPAVDIVYQPEMYGSEYVEEDRTIAVGRFVQADRFTPYMVLGHELLHAYVAEEKDVAAASSTVAREEALTKIWDLHCLDLLDDREQADTLLQQEADFYDEYDGVADTFGSRMAKQAGRFLDWLEHDFDGTPSAGMGALIRYADAYYFDADDSWQGRLVG